VPSKAAIYGLVGLGGGVYHTIFFLKGRNMEKMKDLLRLLDEANPKAYDKISCIVEGEFKFLADNMIHHPEDYFEGEAYVLVEGELNKAVVETWIHHKVSSAISDTISRLAKQVEQP